MDDELWPTANRTEQYIDSLRGAVPLLSVQVDVLLRILRDVLPNPQRILDLGCGDGLLSHALLREYPDAEGVLVDSSAPVLAAAKRRLAEFEGRLQLVEADLQAPNGLAEVPGEAQLAVCGFGVQRLTHARKQAFFREVYAHLAPGGWFFALGLVSAGSGQLTRAHDLLMVDVRWQLLRKLGSDKTRHDVDWDYHNRNDADFDIPAPLEQQLAWLRAAGFEAVDVPMKVLQIALYGGQRPL